MNRLFIISLIFVCFVSISHAQIVWVDGYIIKNDGEKVAGEIKYATPALRSTTCIFRTSNDDEKIKYQPFQIKGYFIEDRLYESKIYDFNVELSYGLGVFMERKNSGTVKIYEYWNTDKERGFTQTFLENDGDYLMEVDPIRFEKQMSMYFEEYPDLQKRITKGEFKKKELMTLVSEFNSWKENNW